MGTLQATRILLRVEWRRFGRWNEFCCSHDPKFRRRWLLMAILGAVLALFFLFYAVAIAYGLQWLGFGALAPGCLYTAAALALTVFEVSRAGSLLFSDQFCQQTVPLPLPRTALLLSRFLTVYLTDLAGCTLLLGPSLCLCISQAGIGLAAVPIALLGLLLLPLLPLCFASLLGAAILAGTSRLRHGNIIGSLLLLIATLLVLVLCFGTTIGMPTDEAEFLSLLEPVLLQCIALYPPADWLTRALAGRFIWLAPLCLISLLPAVLLFGLAAPRYPKLCAALHTGSAKRAASALPQRTGRPVMALYRREWQRYLSCGIYLTNTLVGYLLLVLLAAGYRLVGPQMFAQLGLPAEGSSFLPLVLGWLVCLAPPSACSISLDGPQWDLLRSLPIRPTDYVHSKLLLNLTVGVPCWMITSLLLSGTPTAGWNAAVSGLYLVWGAVWGLSANLHLPLLNWENEVQVVKQSAATLVALLGGTVMVGVPAAALLVWPAGYVYPVLCFALLVTAAALYLHCRQLARLRLGA